MKFQFLVLFLTLILASCSSKPLIDEDQKQWMAISIIHKDAQISNGLIDQLCEKADMVCFHSKEQADKFVKEHPPKKQKGKK